jgi:hypothetical protein
MITPATAECKTLTAVGSGELILPSKPLGFFDSINCRARKCANTSPHNQTYNPGSRDPITNDQL